MDPALALVNENMSRCSTDMSTINAKASFLFIHNSLPSVKKEPCNIRERYVSRSVPYFFIEMRKQKA